MKYVVLLSAAFVLIGTVARAVSESWVEVGGGAFVIQPADLDRLHASLPMRITDAARAQGKTLPRWVQYLIQYQAQLIDGRRAIEIQGSCHHDVQVNIRRVFVGDEIMDGGTCYFTIVYLVDSGRYSNVIFHGLA